jgi:peptidylprolyl isomerase domain and WD repeat-containing protein 1
MILYLSGNATFDETGHFLIFGSLGGIKILNIVTNRIVRVIGASEAGERFLALALYQGMRNSVNLFDDCKFE